MSKKPEFDLQEAHRYFSADCFNRVWGLLDKKERTPEENEEMLRLGYASYWHWTQRPDCSSENLSISYWQLARIYAVIGRAENARRYGQMCLEISQDLPPFFLGYAYEALARAEATDGKRKKADEYLAAAKKASEKVSDEDAKQQLLADLASIA